MAQKKSKLIRMCAGCKKIIDKNGIWGKQGSNDINENKVKITHSLCPDCLVELYPSLNLGGEDCIK